MLTRLFPEIKSTKEEILDLIKQRQSAPSGSKCYAISRELMSLCRHNPHIVAEIIFSDIDEETKERLLFVYSSDHWGSVRSIDNPRWAKLMIEFIIPRLDELPDDIRISIKWYQRVHNL